MTGGGLSGAEHYVRDLKRAVDRQFSEVFGLCGYCVMDMSTGRTVGLRDDVVMPTASTIKIAVLLALGHKVHQGTLKWGDLVPVEEKHRTGGSGVLRSLSGPIQLTVWDLAVLMISYSDNIATNICIDLAGMEYTNDLVGTLGLQETLLRRKMMDEDAWRRGDENVSTPGELVALLAAIENRNGVDESVSSAVIEIMKAQRKGMLGEVVPRDIPVANKPGGLAHVKVDAGLIYFPNRAFAVSVMGAFLSDDDSRKLTNAARVAVDGMKLLATCSELGRA